MIKTTKYIYQSRFALLLLAVFTSSLLIKPAHSLLAHHDHSSECCTNEHELGLTTFHSNDCPICDFEFCTFIPHKQIGIPQAIMIVRFEKSLPTIACLASISSHLFQLRAPPTL